MSTFNDMCAALGEPWADDAFFMFAVLVAGRSAKSMAPKLEALLAHRTRWPTPRDLERPSRMVRRWAGAKGESPILEMKLREVRTGQYRRIGRAFQHWARFGPDMADHTLLDPGVLEVIPGVGPKTARFFLLYRRPAARVAAIDRHALRFLAECGLPLYPGRMGRAARYAYWEGEFLKRADAALMTPMTMDDLIWRFYARGESAEDYDELLTILSYWGLAPSVRGGGETV